MPSRWATTTRPSPVEVGILADGSLDLAALQHQLQEAVQQATVPFRRSCECCRAMNLGACDCATCFGVAERARP